jgi:polyketide biosynthesis enoyl-CoA hydratase PksI
LRHKRNIAGTFGGKVKFTDRDLYSLTLNCHILVISAMQEHGIEDGFVILSRESIYTTNFMKYGFTSGMGSPLILLQKLKISLAEEMMFQLEPFAEKS